MPIKINDIKATTFSLTNKHLILKTYLLNNKKNLDSLPYDKLINPENTKKDNTQFSIFSDKKNFEKNEDIKYLMDIFQSYS